MEEGFLPHTQSIQKLIWAKNWKASEQMLVEFIHKSPNG